MTEHGAERPDHDLPDHEHPDHDHEHPDHEHPDHEGEGEFARPPSSDTPATRAIAALGIAHRVVRTRPAHSAEESADLQGIEPRSLVRTIVVRRAEDDYVFVLLPAGRRFDWPRLRADLGVTRLSLPDAEEARRVTGYERGAITPFGSARAWPVLIDRSAAVVPVIAIGGGARGVNLHLAPGDLVTALEARVVDVSTGE